MQARKTVLIVTYDFPPCSAPGAATRTSKLTKYLRRFGWESVVVCRREPAFDSISTADDVEVIRIPTPIPPRISYQLGAWWWAARIVRPLRNLVAARRPDLIFVSCPPFAYAVAAMRIARESGVPFVVDFRDAWSLDPHTSGGPVKKAAKRVITRFIYSPLESRLLRAAAAAVMNTPSMRQEYAHVYPAHANKLHLVPNGFDDDDFCDAVERPRRERSLLVYCGRLSGLGGRSPDAVLSIIRAALDAGLPVDLEVVGDKSAELRRAISRFHLEPFVHLRGVKSNRQAIEAMRQADVLILYQSPGTGGITPVAGKTFEYLRSGRPILALVPPGDNADVVRRYAPGSVVLESGTPSEAATAIRELLAESKREPARRVDPAFLEIFNRPALAQRMASIFDDAVAGPMRAEAHSASGSSRITRDRVV